MSYSCKKAVIGYLAACGESSFNSLHRECKIQAIDYVDQETVEKAIVELLLEKKISYECVEFLEAGCRPEVYYELNYDEVN